MMDQQAHVSYLDDVIARCDRLVGEGLDFMEAQLQDPKVGRREKESLTHTIAKIGQTLNRRRDDLLRKVRAAEDDEDDEADRVADPRLVEAARERLAGA